MPELKDIGGGFKIVDVGAQTDAAQKQLGLLDLVNRVQAAPLEQQIKLKDLELKTQQFHANEIDTFLKGEKLQFDRNEESRKQNTFITNQLKDISDIYAQSPKMGRIILQKTFPGIADSATNDDGTETITIGTKAFTIDPQGVASPEKRQAIESNYRTQWVEAGKEFALKGQAFKNIEQSYNLGTGAGDVKLLYNWIKINEPGIAGAVREGELILGKSTSSVVQQAVNFYNQAVESNAPQFGEPGSVQRQNFYNTAKDTFDVLKKDTVERGQFFNYLAKKNKLDPRSVIQPIAGLKYEDIVGQETEQAPPPKEIGVRETQASAAPNSTPVPQGGQQPQQAAPAPKFTLDHLMGNIFTIPAGRQKKPLQPRKP